MRIGIEVSALNRCQCLCKPFVFNDKKTSRLLEMITQMFKLLENNPSWDWDCKLSKLTCPPRDCMHGIACKQCIYQQLCELSSLLKEFIHCQFESHFRLSFGNYKIQSTDHCMVWMRYNISIVIDFSLTIQRSVHQWCLKVYNIQYERQTWIKKNGISLQERIWNEGKNIGRLEEVPKWFATCMIDRDQAFDNVLLCKALSISQRHLRKTKNPWKCVCAVYAPILRIKLFYLIGKHERSRLKSLIVL